MQHREGGGVRLLVEGGRRGGDDPHLTTPGPMQAAHRGVDPPPGVRAAPARCGCLPEPVHPRGHQREKVCTLGPRGVPITLCPDWVILGRSFPFSGPQLLCPHVGNSKT